VEYTEERYGSHGTKNSVRNGAKIEDACVAFPPEAIKEVCCSLQRGCQQCISASGGYFNICDFNAINTTMG
jgi:hypothetical protein